MIREWNRRLAGMTAAAALLALGACGDDEDPPDSAVPPGAAETVAGAATGRAEEMPTEATGETIEIDLAEVDSSGTVGLVALQPQGEQTRIDISLGGEGIKDDHPAHIHEGTCDNMNPAPKFPLEALERGRSTTTIDVPLQQLLDGNHVVSVHESEHEMDHRLACGAIVKERGEQ